MTQSTPERARYPSQQGRSVFITGGGSGIGAAIVASFAAQGSRVAFIDVAEDPSSRLVRAITEAGQPAPWWQKCDVCDIAALKAAIATAAAAPGDFHVLVNNVANDDRHTLESVTPEGERDIERNQCLPDRLQAQDIANMVLFLASDDARMCTAKEFVVDGGWC